MTPYDFACDSCILQWEVRLPMLAETKESNCPRCGGAGRRLFSTFASPVSFGRIMWPQRTPTHLLKPRRDDEDRTIWQAKKAAGETMHPAPGKG